MKQIIAIIPARSGSKGVPHKNIKPLAGIPLIAYSIVAALRAELIDRVVVSTDSEDYARIAHNYGAEVPFLRPKELSEDYCSDFCFIQHALDWFLENENSQPDYLVHLRPTTPFRQVEYINQAINSFLNSSTASALRSVHEMPESAYKMFEIEAGMLKCVGADNADIDSANSARQGYTKTFKGNGYVDIISSQFVRQNNRIHGNKVIAFITPQTYEVDTPSDFEYLEYIATKNPSIIYDLFKDTQH